MKRRKGFLRSLFGKIIIPLLAITICQAFIFFAATAYGGVSGTLNQNARDILSERIINKEAEIESKFSSQWTNFTPPVRSIERLYDTYRAQSATPLYADADRQKQLLAEAAPTLIDLLRTNEVTGVFLILNDAAEYTPLQPGAPQSKYGVCIRDYAPQSEYIENEDLLAVRCPSSIIPAVNCSLETWWEALFTFDDKTPGDYYYKPLQTAYEYPDADYTNLAYLDGVHNFGSTDRTVISYSVPLMDETGYPYAVLGIELTTDYLKTLLPDPALYGTTGGCYVLAQYDEGSNEYHTICYNGVLYQQCFANETILRAPTGADGMLRFDENNLGLKLSGSISDMVIYNHNTPFEAEKVALIGIVRDDALYKISRSVEQRILFVALLTMLFGVVAVFAVSRNVATPIRQLSLKVNRMDGTKAPKLDRLNITEIDDLIDSIEGLSDKVNRNLTRTEFFSRMSHDMRTPMNAIIGFSSPELLENADDARLREYLAKVHSSGEYLLSLINEVLDMTKIESERMELREEVTTTHILLAEVVPIIREVAKKRDIEFVLKAPRQTRCIYADKQQVSKVLMNLLSNAVKFTPEGGTVRLEIVELALDEKTVTYSILVQDNGIGMSAEFQKKMYEPFSREGSDPNGTGLGLAIAKQVVTLMGGTMACDSVPGSGTTFTLRLTFELADEAELPAAKAAAAAAAAEKTDVLAGKHVLLCEDHPLNAQIARRLLERRKMVVEDAANGKIGLEKFEAAPLGGYDVILMDIRMPEMDGLETASAIRALDRADAKAIPIIAMTANAFNEDVERSKKAGMNEHLSKPIDPTILYLTLEKYLGEEPE